MTVFYLIRHARTRSNTHGRYMGWIDEGIDPGELGVARAVARRLEAIGISHIYTSPLSRARETAEPLAAVLGLELVSDEAFGEMKMGDWEGMTQTAIAEQYPADWNIWRQDPAALCLPGREMLGDVQQRVGQRLRAIAAEDHKSVAIFTHDVVVRLAILYALGVPASSYRRIAADNCSINSLMLGEGEFTVETMNDMSTYASLRDEPWLAY